VKNGPDGAIFEVRGPTEEAIDAFVLTLRLFVQDNEPISFRNMAELYAMLPIDPELVARFSEGTAKVNAFLDQWSHIEASGRRVSNREVFETYLYGGLAHANPDKKEEFDRWAAYAPLLGMFRMTFTGVITELLGFILWTHEFNRVVLQQLTGTPDAPSAA
jgi:hypothetical protein